MRLLLCDALQIAFLEELGVTSQLVCNMASMSPRILGQDVEQLQSVVAFLKEQGLNGMHLSVYCHLLHLKYSLQRDVE